MTNNQSNHPAGFMRLPAILAVIPVGRSTWWSGVKSGKFPKPVKLGKRTTAWRTEDIRTLIDSFQGDAENGPRPIAKVQTAVTVTTNPELPLLHEGPPWVTRVGKV